MIGESYVLQEQHATNFKPLELWNGLSGIKAAMKEKMNRGSKLIMAKAHLKILDIFSNSPDCPCNPD